MGGLDPEERRPEEDDELSRDIATSGNSEDTDDGDTSEDLLSFRRKSLVRPAAGRISGPRRMCGSHLRPIRDYFSKGSSREDLLCGICRL